VNETINLHLENGYTRISNEILEAIYQCKKLKPLEYKMLLCVIRYSYGYNMTECKLQNQFLVKKIGISKSHVNDTIQSLVKKNIIYKRNDTYGINLNYLFWNQISSLNKEQSSLDQEQKFLKQGTGVPQTRNFHMPQTSTIPSFVEPLKTTLKKELNTTSYKQEKYFKNRREPILTNEEMDRYIKTQGDKHV
jgi:phage replication O-like protein O